MQRFLRYAVVSDRGLKRRHNEDSAFAGPRLIAVADGMGGQAAGEVASALVIAELAPLDETTAGEDLVGELLDAATRANAAVGRHVAANPADRGMGTTLTALLFGGDMVGLLHVGDSRAYLLRRGSLSQITKDETLVQSLVDSGQISPEEAKTHPRRSVVLRAIQGDQIEPATALREALPGDRYLICSDGLSDFVPADVIADGLGIPDPQRAAGELVWTALRSGSTDNVTCLVADVEQTATGYDIPVVIGAARHNGPAVPR